MAMALVLHYTEKKLEQGSQRALHPLNCQLGQSVCDSAVKCQSKFSLGNFHPKNASLCKGSDNLARSRQIWVHSHNHNVRVHLPGGQPAFSDPDHCLCNQPCVFMVFTQPHNLVVEGK